MTAYSAAIGVGSSNRPSFLKTQIQQQAYPQRTPGRPVMGGQPQQQQTPGRPMHPSFGPRAGLTRGNPMQHMLSDPNNAAQFGQRFGQAMVTPFARNQERRAQVAADRERIRQMQQNAMVERSTAPIRGYSVPEVPGAQLGAIRRGMTNPYLQQLPGRPVVHPNTGFMPPEYRR